jgi:two-component system phosphate regulon response regulator PhoB
MLVNDRVVDLAPTEFRLMAFLLENQGRVFNRNELLTRAWAKNIKAGHRTVDVHVRRLRQQLEPFGCEDMIQTVRGFGYRFSAES